MNAPLLDLMQAPHPQTVAADPKLNVFVTANAGSGKTTTLVNRVARLLLDGARPEALLCVTYTKAAAAEMQTRLFQVLGAWAVAGDATLREELAKIGEGRRELHRARRLFARALETPGGLKIQTIHAFCEKLLRRFPLEAGVSPGFQVLEDVAAAEVSRSARDALARHALAAPDSALGQAYAHFAVQLDYQSFEELFVAFEARRRQTAAFLQWCEEGQSTPEREIWRLCGFHEVEEAEAVAAGALAPCEMARWADAAAALANGGKQDRELAGRLTEVIACAEASGHSFDQCLQAFSTAQGKPLSRVGSQAISVEARAWLEAERDRLHAACERVYASRTARDTVRALTLAKSYLAAYEAEKARTNALDFADLIARTNALLREREDAAWVLYKLDGGIDHLLVDEAQDTAPEQWEIIEALTGEFFAGAGRRGADDARTVFAVGDEKQSIYSFQGAQPERLKQERAHVEAAALGAGRLFKGVELTESWRSTPQVLAFVDALFAEPDLNRLIPDPEGAVIVKHETKRPEHPGCVDLWPLEQDVKADDPEDLWAPVDAEPQDNARKRLAKRIALWIKDACARGEAVWDKEAKAWRAMRPGDVLILVRRREAVFEEILRALKRYGLPVAGADRLRLSEHIVFDDLLALCRFALYPDDELSLATLLRSPFCDLAEEGPSSLMALALGREERLWATLRARAGERAAWTEADAYLDARRKEARALAPFEFLTRALGATDGAGRSMRQRILTRLGREAEDALDEVLNQALAHEGRGVRDLERFTAALEKTQVEVKRELEAAGGAVRVMTVHGAKGLEATVVILPDTTSRIEPERTALLPTDHGGFLFAPRTREDGAASAAARQARKERTIQEGSRLLYVALTRARDRLIVCGRLRADRKEPDKGCWYEQIARGFARPEIAGRVRRVEEGGQTILRYGPDPRTSDALGAIGGAVSPLPAWARALPAAESPTLDYASPSDFTRRKRKAAPSPLARAEGGLGRFRRGDVIHRLLQLLPDFPETEREAAAARLLAKETDLTAEQRAEMAAAALAVLRHPVFAEVFGPGSRAESAIAGAAPDLPAGLAVSGRVDRMLAAPDRVLVVDFKTNRQAPRTVAQADEAYLVQMAVYVAVLRAIFPGRRVEAALVWTDGPSLMPIPEEVIAATLAGLRAQA